MSAMPDIERNGENPERDAWYQRLLGSPEQVLAFY